MDLRTLEDMPPWEWPDGTGALLLDTLSNTRAAESDRLLATKLAGDLTVIDDELVDSLLSILQSRTESTQVREWAALSLGPVIEFMDLEGLEDPDDAPISESTFRRIQDSLTQLYREAEFPGAVRRRILEASVRAPQEWHREAIDAAFTSNDERWKHAAVYGMQYVPGFDGEILDALNSRNRSIQYEAVCAAGIWQIDAAWPQIEALVSSPATRKPLLLAAIDAVAAIRPKEAAEVLDDLLDSEDEDVVEAVYEALAMAEEGMEEEDGGDLPF